MLQLKVIDAIERHLWGSTVRCAPTATAPALTATSYRAPPIPTIKQARGQITRPG